MVNTAIRSIGLTGGQKNESSAEFYFLQQLIIEKQLNDQPSASISLKSSTQFQVEKIRPLYQGFI